VNAAAPVGIRRQYVDVPFGQMHVARSSPAPRDGGFPVLLLHQTPRSWDEYAEVIPLLGRTREVVAVDLPGMGGSDAHPGGASIEHFADGVVRAVDGLGIDRFDLVGHHTGGVVAFEVAATEPMRVRRLVLSSTPFVDAEGRVKRAVRPPIDGVEVAVDGRHLMELWQRRQRFYPEGRPDLLARFVRDALRVRDPEDGHRAVAAYVMEQRVPAIVADVLLVGHGADPYAYPELDTLAAALGQPEQAVIEHGMVPLEHSAAEFATIVEAFLSA
jgi:pimeloyl-ACP methyl ester carboxylesterase